MSAHHSLDYATYLALPSVLGAQQPLSDPSDTQVHQSEHFFIVVHQAAELWSKQLLLDLERAESLMDAAGEDLMPAVEHLRRASAIMDLLVAHMRVAGAQLPVADFAAFRPLLGTASGAQSRQFMRLERQLGLVNGVQSSVSRALLDVVSQRGTDLAAIYREPARWPELHQLAEAVADLSDSAWLWHEVHLHATARLIGTMPGTGGSDGVGYLAQRVRTPFPELWRARGEVHESPAGRRSS